MMKWYAVPFVGFAILLIAGCAGSTPTPGVVGGPPVNVGGQWAGTAGVGATAAPVSLSLVQDGAAVSGAISIGGRPDLSGPVVGTVQGNTVSLDLRNGYGSLPDLTAAPERITGILSLGPMSLRRAR
jgi:hypothetical protein